jgi:hypothetical protein
MVGIALFGLLIAVIIVVHSVDALEKRVEKLEAALTKPAEGK